jgi:hypothetical protein
MATYPLEIHCLRCGARMVVVSPLAALICRLCIDEVLAAHRDRESA